jgi:DNA-binding GntR family transcriptional regulator
MMPNTINLLRWSQNGGKSDVARSANLTLPKVVVRGRRAPLTYRARESAKRSKSSLAIRPVQTLTEQAYCLIEEQIVTLRLKPGEILSEQGLSATIKIGRTPIREALQRLAREGLVTILPRKGILVTDLNPRTQLLALEVRGELERLLSRVGAERATSEQRARLLEIARGMDQAAKTNNALKFMSLDRELNQLLTEAAHNDFAARSMKLLQGLSRRFWYMHYREAADLPLCARLHADQARSIANGDAAAAVRASDRLMDYVGNFTRATVSM